MTTVESTDTRPETRSPVVIALESVVERLTTIGGEINLRDEAERIINYFRVNDPTALFDYFDDMQVSIMREQLQLRLARVRYSRRSIFETTGKMIGVLQTPYPGLDNRWQQLADMRRPDWRMQLEQHTRQARPSLIQIELAKIMIARLPDDQTPTSEITTEGELEQLLVSLGETVDQALANGITSTIRRRRP